MSILNPIVEDLSVNTKQQVADFKLNDVPPLGYLFKTTRPNLTADDFLITDDTIISDDTILVGYRLPGVDGTNYAELVALLNGTIWYTSGSPNSLHFDTITDDNLTNTSTVIAGSGGKVVIYPAGTDTTKIDKAKKWAGVPIL